MDMDEEIFLKEYGLSKEDICSIGFGGFIKKKDKEELKNLTQRHRKEKQEAIEQINNDKALKNGLDLAIQCFYRD